jgi:hypothetical protein
MNILSYIFWDVSSTYINDTSGIRMFFILIKGEPDSSKPDGKNIIHGDLISLWLQIWITEHNNERKKVKVKLPLCLT